MRPAITVVALLVAAAACGDGGSPAPTSVPPATTAAPATTVTQPPATLAPSLGRWTETALGEGIKPVLALDSDGTPAVAWVHEDLAGFLAYASAAGGWAVETITEGYFYGPIGLAFDPADGPHVVWHDHQDRTVREDKGDLVHAVRSGTGWEIGPALDDGHDGWDSTVAIGSDGIVRAAGVDPAQFGRQEGVEYYELGPAGWQVEAIGSGPAEYEWNVSLALDAGGEPALTWFDPASQDLRFAQRVEGIWSIETVASDGDVGRFSSLAFDRDGRPHVSFIRFVSPDQSDVLYASRGSDGWQVQEVTKLFALFVDHVGARRSTAVAIAPDGSPVVAYTDQAVLGLATPAEGGSWERETVLQAGEQALGQLVSMAIGADGTLHLATYRVTRRSPLEGEIVYLTRAT